jgi:hypothetical protein
MYEKPLLFRPVASAIRRRKTRAVPMHAYTMMGPEIHANSIQIFSASQIEIYIPHIYTLHHRERGGNPDTYKFILRFSSPPQLILSPIPNSSAKKFRFMCSQKRNCAASVSISTFLCLLATYSIPIFQIWSTYFLAAE